SDLRTCSSASCSNSEGQPASVTSTLDSVSSSPLSSYSPSPSLHVVKNSKVPSSKNSTVGGGSYAPPLAISPWMNVVIVQVCPTRARSGSANSRSKKTRVASSPVKVT